MGSVSSDGLGTTGLIFLAATMHVIDVSAIHIPTVILAMSWLQVYFIDTIQKRNYVGEYMAVIHK